MLWSGPVPRRALTGAASGVATLVLAGCGGSGANASLGCARISTEQMPALVRSSASPGEALLSTLSGLRDPATAIDHTPLGSWDRYPYRIRTIFTRYVRIYDGPHKLQVAFFPTVNCTFSGFAGATDSGSIALMMHVLGNPATVFAGTAREIMHGHALPGIDVSDSDGDHPTAWLQAIVVPNGVARVVMDFTPPNLHPYTNSIVIHRNVGLVVRRPPYSPTTVLWYGKSGRLLKTFHNPASI